MSPLERDIRSLQEQISALPESIERTIAQRAARHALSLLSRDIISASDAFYRARKYFIDANQNKRKAS